jgi:hypothetical protein
VLRAVVRGRTVRAPAPPLLAPPSSSSHRSTGRRRECQREGRRYSTIDAMLVCALASSHTTLLSSAPLLLPMHCLSPGSASPVRLATQSRAAAGPGSAVSPLRDTSHTGSGGNGGAAVALPRRSVEGCSHSIQQCTNARKPLVCPRPLGFPLCRRHAPITLVAKRAHAPGDASVPVGAAPIPAPSLGKQHPFGASDQDVSFENPLRRNQSGGADRLAATDVDRGPSLVSQKAAATRDWVGAGGGGGGGSGGSSGLWISSGGGSGLQRRLGDVRNPRPVLFLSRSAVLQQPPQPTPPAATTPGQLAVVAAAAAAGLTPVAPQVAVAPTRSSTHGPVLRAASPSASSVSTQQTAPEGPGGDVGSGPPLLA